MESRYTKLFIALIVSALLVYLARELEGRIFFIDSLPYLKKLPELLFDLLHLIAIILFFKFSFLWIKELWKLK